MLVSSTPVNGDDEISQSDAIILVFSEAMNTSTLSYTVSPTTAGSTSWSAGNTTVSLSAVAGFSATTQTVTITGANDTTGNAFVGAGSGAANPFSFGVRTGVVSATVTLITPNGGESYAPGDTITVKWTWTGGSSSSNVHLVFSSDSFATSSTIAQFTTPGVGEYRWTVPNTPTTSALIKIVRSESGSFTVQDYSNFSFSIQSIASSPSGGESSSNNSDDQSTEADEESQSDDSAESYELGERIDLPAVATSPFNGKTESVQDVSVGDVIVGRSYSTVYYITTSGTRRPFMNAQVFFTYYESFDAIQEVTDATLGQLDLGAPMLPKSGVVLVKVQSDPKVYALEDITGDENRAYLRWIPSERIANDVFGSHWDEYVIDVPVTLFTRFRLGDPMSGDDIEDTDILKKRSELVES